MRESAWFWARSLFKAQKEALSFPFVIVFCPSVTNLLLNHGGGDINYIEMLTDAEHG